MRTRRSDLLLLLIPGLISGRCDNACTFTSRAISDIAGKPVPWDCPM